MNFRELATECAKLGLTHVLVSGEPVSLEDWELTAPPEFYWASDCMVTDNPEPVDYETHHVWNLIGEKMAARILETQATDKKGRKR